MSVPLIAAGVAAAGAFAAFVSLLRARNMHLWLGAHLRRAAFPRPEAKPPVHVFVAVCDHFEPAWAGADLDRQRARVDEWMRRYPPLADRHRDADGRPPQHSFFYPEEEYLPEHLDRLADLCRRGYGDVEVHLHHRGDTAEGLREKLVRFKTVLFERHGLLRRDGSGQVVYAFIHGNWALDNSGRGGDWCGVNDELIVLRETGCYADFTFPSAPSETQPGTINEIYYATDDPARPRSHERGVPVRVGGRPSGDLMLIQGPLTLDWGRRKWGLLPRIENADLTGDNPPAPRRVALWMEPHVHVLGRPDWVFVKLHTHGAQENNREALLGPAMDETLAHLESTYNHGSRHRLHYVTAREMYDLVKAAEAGDIRDPAAVLGRAAPTSAPPELIAATRPD